MAKGILMVQGAPAAGRDQEFNDWYNDIHLVDIMKIAGFTAARRFKRIDAESDNPYLAIYEVEADDLHAAYAAIGAGVANGEVRMSDVMSFEPAPVMGLYEQVYEHEG
jgi:hypothetical protein